MIEIAVGVAASVCAVAAKLIVEGVKRKLEDKTTEKMEIRLPNRDVRTVTIDKDSTQAKLDRVISQALRQPAADHPTDKGNSPP
jgi:hypothetical protein